VIVIIDNAKYHHAKLHAAWRQEQQARSPWTSCHLTAPNSTPSSGCEADAAETALHNVYFPNLTLVVQASRNSLPTWSAPTQNWLRSVSYNPQYIMALCIEPSFARANAVFQRITGGLQSAAILSNTARPPAIRIRQAGLIAHGRGPSESHCLSAFQARKPLRGSRHDKVIQSGRCEAGHP